MGADNTFGEVNYNPDRIIKMGYDTNQFMIVTGNTKNRKSNFNHDSIEFQLQQLEEKAKELVELRKQFDQGVSLQAMMIFTANEFYERKMMSLKQ